MIDLAVASDLDVTEARAVTERIREWVQVGALDIERAWHGRAWIALGYESWERYCRSEFGEHIRLPRAERQAVVIDLHAAGMSTRAIAAATGVSNQTIGRDLAVAPNGATTPTTITGIDGKGYPRKAYSARMPISQRVEQIRNLADRELSPAAIGDLLGISGSHVSEVARSAGIAIGKKSTLAKAQRIERTRTLAAEGATSQQIADELGVGDDVVRLYARDHDIELTANTMTRVRTMDSVRIVTATIDVLDGIDVMFEHIDYAALPAVEVDGWVSVLNTSIRSLTTLRKQLKEMTQP